MQVCPQLDLLPPREWRKEYPGVWKDGVDRWYGQDMPVEQLERIKKYYKETHSRDKPVWAYALRWFYAQEPLGMYPMFQWDFGIWQDALSLQRGRIQERTLRLGMGDEERRQRINAPTCAAASA